MSLRRPAVVVAMCVAVAGSLHAVQEQIAPRLPPPKTSVYDFLDLGQAPSVSCTCVPNAFALPSYRPRAGYASGAATPLEDARMSESSRRMNQEWYAQERETARRMAQDGLAGNANASLALAQHLDLNKTIVGPDERVEEETVRWLTLAAQQGHDAAFRLLGQRYAHGWGVKADYTTAAYWFDQGARHDDPISMTAIGFLHAAGRGVAQNWEAAIRWWQRAESRTPLAGRLLGDAYACGTGVAENHERADAAYGHGEESSVMQRGYLRLRRCVEKEEDALGMFRGPAHQGFPEAQVTLSELLLEGRGADPDTLEAYRWARLAEWRLPDGQLKKRAADLAAAAARAWPAPVIAAEDRMIKEMIASAAGQSR